MVTAMDVSIGTWVRRDGGKWHVVESIVSGDVVTRCGRRMVDPLAEVSKDMPLTRAINQTQLCKAGCS